MRTHDENNSLCTKCDDSVTQYDTDGGLWVGSLKNGGSYDCPSGGLHAGLSQADD